jgi:hypothetical protein
MPHAARDEVHGSKFALSVCSKPNHVEQKLMPKEQPSEVDMKLMEEALQEAHNNLANGGAGVAARRIKSSLLLTILFKRRAI